MQKATIVLSALAAGITQALSVQCAEGDYWNQEACKCFREDTCAPYVRLSYGKRIDPRTHCDIISSDEYDEIMAHPGLGDDCMPIMTITTTIQEPWDCDNQGNKICNIKARCQDGQRWDDKACMCMSLMQCRKMCPYGQALDPRENCVCVDQSIVDALFQCENTGLGSPVDEEEPNFDCDREGNKICTRKEICPSGYHWDEEGCMCATKYKCKIGCGAGRTLDPRERCSCVDDSVVEDLYTCEPDVITVTPVEEEAEFDCDREGNKICTTQQRCPKNYQWDDEGCMCTAIFQCEIYCGRGKTLDPREQCRCVDEEVVDELYTCEPDEPLSTSIPAEPEYDCDSEGNKICLTREKCENGVWDEKACMCVSQIHCMLWCGEGMALDPRFGCKCVEQSVKDALYTCEPEEEVDECDLTPDMCPNEFFIVNDDCECQCDIVCIATMSVDSENCQCVPLFVDEPETVITTPKLEPCDEYGHKICENSAQSCARGEVWDEKACMCMSRGHCRIGCPRGQLLHPAEFCQCVDKSVVFALYECEPQKVVEERPTTLLEDPYTRPILPQRPPQYPSRRPQYNGRPQTNNYWQPQRPTYGGYGYRSPQASYSPYQPRSSYNSYRPQTSNYYGGRSNTSYAGQRPSYSSRPSTPYSGSSPYSSYRPDRQSFNSPAPRYSPQPQQYGYGGSRQYGGNRYAGYSPYSRW